MRKLIKTKNILISFVLAFLTCFSFVLPNFLNKNPDISTREVNVSEIGSLTYEEKVQQILGFFDDYSANTSEDLIEFNGSVDVSSYDFSGIQYLSTDAEKTTKTYHATIDKESEKLHITTKYIQDEKVVFSETIDATPVYDEATNDYFVTMPDGEVVSISKMLNEGNYDECLLAEALTLFTAKELAVILGGMVIVAYPQVTEAVVTIVTTVVSWVRSFFSWLFSWLIPVTTTTTTQTIVTTYSYNISIDGKKIEATPYDKTRKFSMGKFYVAIPDTVDGKMYISSLSISRKQAVAILKGFTRVNCANKAYASKTFLVSIYTLLEADARSVAEETALDLWKAGFIGAAGAVKHKGGKIGYFDHFHPGLDYDETKNAKRSHAFFGLPF